MLQIHIHYLPKYNWFGPSVTPSITPTQTLEIKILGIGGTIDYEIFDNLFNCGIMAKFINCSTLEEYFITTPIYFGDIEINENYVKINIGEDDTVCMIYDSNTFGSSTHYIYDIISAVDSGSCDDCTVQRARIEMSPTPTTTTTNTMTPSVRNYEFKYVFERCDDNILIVQNHEVSGINIGDVVKSNGICYEFVDMLLNTFDLQPYRYVEYNYNFIGSKFTNYENCTECGQDESVDYLEIKTPWTFEPCFNTICDVQGPETSLFIRKEDENNLENVQVWSNDKLNKNFTPGRYLLINNEVYYVQNINMKSYLQKYCSKGTPY